MFLKLPLSLDLCHCNVSELNVKQQCILASDKLIKYRHCDKDKLIWIHCLVWVIKVKWDSGILGTSFCPRPLGCPLPAFALLPGSHLSCSTSLYICFYWVWVTEMHFKILFCSAFVLMQTLWLLDRREKNVPQRDVNAWFFMYCMCLCAVIYVYVCAFAEISICVMKYNYINLPLVYQYVGRCWPLTWIW